MLLTQHTRYFIKLQYEGEGRIKADSQMLMSNYGTYYDHILVPEDERMESAGHELLDVINGLDVEPKWVPASWLRAPSASSASTEAAQQPMSTDASSAPRVWPVQHTE